jgi:hypothetical protein
MAEDAGFEHNDMSPTAATGGEGDGYSLPGEPGVQIMWEKGDPESYGDPVHNGPYVKYQVSKAAMGGKKWEGRVPADGNPDPLTGLDGGLPPQAQAWMDENAPSVEPGSPSGGVEFPEVGAP